MLRRILLWAAAVLGVGLIGLVALGWWAYVQLTGPMYEPGSLATSAGLQPPPQDDDTRAWTVRRHVDLHHFSRGSGRPVLFIHGGPGVPVRTPMPWLDALYPSFEVHFYDQRGCGASTRPIDRFESPKPWPNMQTLEATLGLGVQVSDIERIRRILGEDRLTLIGHSFGGFLAALYAAEFPQRVEKLVLLAPASVLTLPAEDDEDLFALVRSRLSLERRAEYDAFLDQYMDFRSLFRHDEQLLAKRNLRLGNYILEAMGRSPLAIPDHGGPLETGGWMVQAMYLSMGRHHDYCGALEAISVPTLVVHGDKDLQPVSASARYAELIADAELVRVPDADHFFSGAHPDLRGRVGTFLAPPTAGGGKTAGGG